MEFTPKVISANFLVVCSSLYVCVAGVVVFSPHFDQIDWGAITPPAHDPVVRDLL